MGNKNTQMAVNREVDKLSYYLYNGRLLTDKEKSIVMYIKLNLKNLYADKKDIIQKRIHDVEFYL